MLRMVVNPAEKLEESALVPYDSILPQHVGSVKFGSVTRIVPGASEGGEIELENGEVGIPQTLCGPLCSLSELTSSRADQDHRGHRRGAAER